MDADTLLSRGLSSLLALAAAVTCSFCLVHAMPGDYVEYLLNITPGGFNLAVESAMLKSQFDLDKPLIVRYGLYLADIFRGNWGVSFAYAQPVSALLGRKVLWSLALLLPAKLLSLLLGTALGAYSGWHAERRRDFVLLFGMLSVNAVPTYVWALLSLLVFAFHFSVFPLSGFVGLEALDLGLQWSSIVHHGALPLIVLTICGVPGTYYLVRNTMSLVAREDYITTARAAGIEESRLLLQHALPNALLPVVTLIPLQLAGLMMGSMFIETVFSWPGVGLLTFQAIAARDLPVLQGALLVYSGLLIAGNLLADLSYGLIDPRVRTGV